MSKRPRLKDETVERLAELADGVSQILGTEVTIAQVVDMLATRCPGEHVLVGHPEAWTDLDQDGPVWTDLDRIGPEPEVQRAPAPARIEALNSPRARSNTLMPRSDVLAPTSARDLDTAQSRASATAVLDDQPPPELTPARTREEASAQRSAPRAHQPVQMPLGDIVRAYGAVCEEAGMAALPPYLLPDLVDELREAWAEVPDLETWLRALARLPRCRQTLAGRVSSLRALIRRPPFALREGEPPPPRNIWRVLEGECDDERQQRPEPRRGRTPSLERPWRHTTDTHIPPDVVDGLPPGAF